MRFGGVVMISITDLSAEALDAVKRNDVAASARLLRRKMPVDILVALTAWAVLPFVPKSTNRMPRWLRWYEDFNYGLNGDPYWVAQHGEGVTSYRNRLAWVLRNANVWDHEHGVKPQDLVDIQYVGDPRVGNRPLVEGELAIWAWDKDGVRYWEYYTVKKTLPGRCYRSRIGWKLKDALDEFLATGQIGKDPNQREILPAVFTMNPLMGYTEV